MGPINISAIIGGEILAKSITDEDGRVLLSKGVRIKTSFLNKLEQLGLTEIYIEDELSEGIIIEDSISFETKSDVKKVIKKEIERFTKSRDFNFAEISRITDMLSSELLGHKESLLNVRDIRNKDGFLFNHIINVTTMAIILTQKLGGTYDKIKVIGMGCLLHDVGKMFLPDDVIRNEHNLVSKDLEDFEQHPQLGYNMLKDSVEIRPASRIIALQHHERLDGSGYPNGLRDEEIHYGAKLCAVCDAFDIMLNSRDSEHVVKTSYSVEYLQSCRGTKFDSEMVTELLENIPIYPEGTLVLLSNGILAIVVKNNKLNLTRPKVRFFYDFKKKVKVKQKEVDLAVELNINIERELLININKL